MAQGKPLFPFLAEERRRLRRRGVKPPALRGAKRFEAEYKLLVRVFGDPPDPMAVFQATNAVAPNMRGRPSRHGYRRLNFLWGYHVEAHRLVAAAQRGGPLQPRECVHHRDGDPRNNHPGNLEILPGRVHHWAAHKPAGGTRIVNGSLFFTSGPHRGHVVARRVLEAVLGRKLRRGECTGYRDGNHRNISAANLFARSTSDVKRQAWVTRRAEAKEGAGIGHPVSF